MIIRRATRNDVEEIRSVYLAAFPGEERELVSRLAVDLLFEEASPPVLALVAEAEGTVAGHIAFSPVSSRDSGEPLGYLLAPLAVDPGFQKQGIASRLIGEGRERLREPGSGVLLVYGDPAFYGRFGFSAAIAERYLPPHPMQSPFGWQGIAPGEAALPPGSVPIACVPPLGNPALW